jgi:hypothetical protein
MIDHQIGMITDNQEQDLTIRTKQAKLDKLMLELEKLRLENDELRSRPARYIRRFQPFFTLVMAGIVPVILSYPSLRCIGTVGRGTPVLTALTSRKGSTYIDT